MARRAIFELHGVGVVVEGDPEAVAELRVHFAAFEARAQRATSPIRVALRRAAPELPPRRMVADQVVDRGIVYNDGAATWIDHHGRALSHYDFDREQGEVQAPRCEDLVELGYLMIHSRLGQALEAHGLVRLHCLSFAQDGAAAIVLTPSGGGKSRLALALLQSTRVELLGDDMVLIDRQGRAHPFHTPIGVSSPELAGNLGPLHRFERRLHPPKWVLGLPGLEPRLASGAHEVALIALARRVSRPPGHLRSSSRSKVAAALWRDMVVGLGLPQVLELVARHGIGDLPSQAPVAGRRALAAARLARGAQALDLEVSDPETAALQLVEALKGRRPTDAAAAAR